MDAKKKEGKSNKKMAKMREEIALEYSNPRKFEATKELEALKYAGPLEYREALKEEDRAALSKENKEN